MSEQVADALLRLAIIWFLVGLWLLTIVYVFWDANRRNLGDSQILRWVVIAALPLLGPILYLRTRQTQAPSRAPGPPSRAPVERHTRVRRYETGREEGTLSTIPAEAWRSQEGQPGSEGITLVGLEGPYAGAHFQLHTFPARIGRNTTCRVCLDQDTAVSRQHAEVYRQDGAVCLRDLNSTHGTYLNGDLVADQPLFDGDTVQVGNSSFIIVGRQ